MSRPRSSRRASARIATFHVDDEVEVSSSLLQNDSLHDGASGAGPPASSLQGDTDLTEAPGSVAHNERMEPSLDDNGFAFAKIDEKTIAPCDRWAQRLIGKRFRREDEELEDDLQLKTAHPTSAFVVFSIVARSAERRQLLQANARHARRSLRFICYSFDAMDDYELTPVNSFHPSVQERSRLYQASPLEAQLDRSSNLSVNEAQQDSYDSSTDFMQGVADSHKAFSLAPLQIGVFLASLPPTRGYTLSQRSLHKLRRAFGVIVKKLTSDGLSDDEKSGWANALMALPCTLLQRNKSEPDEEKRNSLYSTLLSGDALSAKVGDFKRKAMKVKSALSKRLDFQSRRHRQADISVRNGDYAKAMEPLLRVNSKVNFSAIENVVNESLPSRSYNELSLHQRRDLFAYVDSSSDDFLLTTNDALRQLKKTKKSRSPGLDGVTIERLNSVLLGGDRDDAYKREALSDYAMLLNKRVKSDFTESQKKLPHSLRLAAAPKTEEESRATTTLGVHSKATFSAFAASDLKKRVEKESLTRQRGAKPAGAEAIAHAFQQAIAQNPDYDAFSADAAKAFYSLSRDVTMRKLKEVAPQAFNFFMDKRSCEVAYAVARNHVAF